MAELTGSPPPMRGKAAAYLTKHIAQRITPAYAGKSQPYIYKLNHYKDHPRLCGEKKATTTPALRKRGSPPPMRGKVKEPLSEYELMTDHPRLCGEKAAFAVGDHLLEGSPPPMRGKGSFPLFR